MTESHAVTARSSLRTKVVLDVEIAGTWRIFQWLRFCFYALLQYTVELKGTHFCWLI